MNARDEILNTLRAARGVLPPSATVARGVDHFHDRPLTDASSMLSNFQDKLSALKGESYVVHSLSEAREKIEELTAAVPKDQILYSSEELVRQVAGPGAELLPLEKMPHDSMKRFDVGVTGCLSLIARTGSVVVSSSETGRRLSVLTPFHIVVARRDQLVMSLEDAFPKLESDTRWSYAAVITGPSRTADIEKILVLGAHGPKRFAVVVIDG